MLPSPTASRRFDPKGTAPHRRGELLAYFTGESPFEIAHSSNIMKGVAENAFRMSLDDETRNQIIISKKIASQNEAMHAGDEVCIVFLQFPPYTYVNVQYRSAH